MTAEDGEPSREALLREVVALRSQVAELQRRAARHQDTLEVSLSEREELLREAERIAHLGTWAWDMETGRVAWSDEMYRILGISRDHVASVESFFAAVHPEDREEAIRVAEQAKIDGVMPLVEVRVVRPDGSVRYTYISGSCLFDTTGAARRMVGGMLDRTENIQVEAQLRSALALLEEAQSLAHLGSWSFDPETRELKWSDEFRRIAALDPDVKPEVELFLSRVIEEDRERFVDEYRKTLHDPEAGAMDGRLLLPSGEIRHIRMRGALSHPDGGRPLLRGTMLDVTDQVRMREELVHSQKMEAVGRLAGGIAHDFNNLLTVVIGNVELFAEELGPCPEIDDCMKALESAARLTQRLLAFGRKAQLTLRVVDPNELILSTTSLMQRLIGDQIFLRTDLDKDSPNIKVDPVQIERALVNLVVNAKNVMSPGGTVTIATVPGTYRGAPSLELSVSDQGPGISEQEKSHLFEPFYTTRQSSGGTGLGLPTVLGTAEQHGGTVRVESRPEGGSVFTIVLPATTEELSAESSRSPVSSGKLLRSLRILVVDDETQVAEVARRILVAHGHTVHVADGPEQAMLLWEHMQEPIDLLICDVVMPKMGGPELVRSMLKPGTAAQVLFMSGYNEASTLANFEHPFVAKPFTARQLLDAISIALE